MSKIKDGKKFWAIFLSLTLIIGLCSFTPAYAANSFSEVDTYLLQTGMPQNIIDTLDTSIKETIFNSSNGSPKEFVGIETKAFVCDNGSETGIAPAYISAADMTVEVVAFRESADYQGYPQYSIYPSFEWKKEVNIKNDKFGFSLPSGWEVVAGEKNLSLYYDDPYQSGIKWKFAGDISRPCEAYYTGYGFDGFDAHCQTSILYKGNAYFYAYKKDLSARDSLKVGYYHDGSTLTNNTSFGISIGIFDVSVSGSSSGVESFEDIFDF